MERVTSFVICAIVVFCLVLKASCNVESDALYEFKTNLVDPNNVLQSWDPTLNNPCTWFHVTCNDDNTVNRVDLGSTGLSGQLVPQLGQLSNLQFLQLYNTSITGNIPNEFANLTNLIALDLYFNALTGPIPTSLANLQKLRFLRLNNNNLTGQIPMSLTNLASLQILDLSNNNLTGIIPTNGSFASFPPASFQNNPGLIRSPSSGKLRKKLSN